MKHSHHIRNSSSLTVFLVQILDIFAIFLGGWLAYGMRRRFDTPFTDVQSGEWLLIASVAFFGVLFFERIYSMSIGRSLAAMVGSATLGWVLTWLSLIVVLVLTKSAEQFSRIWLVTWLAMGLAFLWGMRVTVFFALSAVRRSGYQRKSVLLCGDSTMLAAVRERIKLANWSGYEVIETVAPGDGKSLAALDEKLRPDEIWIGLNMTDQARVDALLHSLGRSVANIRLMPDLQMYQILNYGISLTVGIPMVDISISPMFGSSRLTKALFDYLLATLALVVFSPIMVAIAVAVKLTSAGPVLFRQKRHGWNGEEIVVYKFRSMVVHEEQHGVVTQAKREDPRVTRLGQFLRRTSLDELPQFINVLQGRMSIVGPRPHALAHNHDFVQHIPRYAQRHKVKPGITGWAQVCGYRGETDTIDKMEERIKHDLYYLEHWSIWMDLKIVLLTPLAVINNKGVY